MIETQPEGREAAYLAAEIKRKKEKKARQANAGKQKRYRESMKAQGYRARLIWDKPLEPGWVRMAAPVIRESSIDFARNNPAVKEVLDNLYGSFIFNCEKKGIPKKEWEPIYRDFQTLLKPLYVEE